MQICIIDVSGLPWDKPYLCCILSHQGGIWLRKVAHVAHLTAMIRSAIENQKSEGVHFGGPEGGPYGGPEGGSRRGVHGSAQPGSGVKK